MKTWNVRVYRAGTIEYIGQVQETSEELARCAALYKFGICADEDNDPQRTGIREGDGFDVGEAY